MSERVADEDSVHRYFEEPAKDRVKSPAFTRRAKAWLAGSASFALALGALWSVKYEPTGWVIGFVLVVAALASCSVARWADRDVRVMPAIAMVMTVFAGSMLLTRLISHLLFQTG